MANPEFTILTPNAMLDYGYNSDHFWYGIEKYRPAAIIVDSGSTDGGPYKLGMKKTTCGRGSYVRDLEPILAAPSPWGLIGGLHETLDGYVRIHDSFPNHAEGALALLGLPKGASRQQVSQETAK
ncbi:hypothetical protein M431DRAFT_488548 [Trichoderma harzianum CBS 226.95]|uniref:Uncharacterized protein n=1 Tax=Trichoderma harzianum CBS 226.95 TaxID=983964 RepID=A0A2T3ZRQ8_TRIHA|nr:hypothetical protein M431DRAFT_488548 [Trichoderma harzianum CBS 226.95]PTB47493.1 hypothetical protein M431DRAFT_488548 [Trichoderma harzianum CBS 226.95]